MLARLLLPEDFGIFAFAMANINFLGAFQIKKIGTTLIQRLNQVRGDPSLQSRVIGTTLVIRIFSSTVLFLVTYFFTPFLTGLLQKNQLILPIRVLSLLFLLEALMVVPRNLMLWELDFKSYVLVDLSARIVQMIVAVLLGLFGAGVWSLVYSAVVANIVLVTLSWLCRPVRSIHFDIKEARKIISFTVPLWLSSQLLVLRDIGDKWILGVFTDEVSLGYYSVAYGLAMLPVSFTKYVVRVGFPLFSKLQSDKKRLRTSIEMGIKYTIILVFPATIGMILLARPIIEIVYTSRWLPMLSTLIVLCLAAPLSGLNTVLAPVFVATNRPRFSFILSITRVLMLLLLGIPMITQSGLIGFCFALVATETLVLAFSLCSVFKILEPKIHFLRPLIASFGLGAILHLFLATHVSDLHTLFLVIMIGVVSYAAILTFLEGRSIIDENIDLVQRIFLEKPTEEFVKDD